MKLKKILFYGAKSQCYIVYNVLAKKLYQKKFFPKTSTIIPGFSFDEKLKKPYFSSNLIFSNKFIDLKLFIKKSQYFVNCIGSHHGYARCETSKMLKSSSLLPLNIFNKSSNIDESVLFGEGNLIMNSVTINIGSILGDYCIVNTQASIDHECIISNGVHIMGGASIAGRVKIGNYATIGTNATILPDISIGEGAYVGAGAVVTKNVKKNQIVAGNPAKYIRMNKHFKPSIIF